MPWVVVLSTLLVLTVNGLANALPIGGVTTGQVSDGAVHPQGSLVRLAALAAAGACAALVVVAVLATRKRQLADS